MVLNTMQRCVVAGVSLIFPDMDYEDGLAHTPRGWNKYTEGFAFADFCPPASHQVDLSLRVVGHSRIPLAHEIDVVVDLIRLYIVEDDRVDVFASGEHLGKRPFHVFVHSPSFRCTVDQAGQGTRSLRGCVCFSLPCFFCRRRGRE